MVFPFTAIVFAALLFSVTLWSLRVSVVKTTLEIVHHRVTEIAQRHRGPIFPKGSFAGVGIRAKLKLQGLVLHLPKTRRVRRRLNESCFACRQT
jgi:hypothetical protein